MSGARKPLWRLRPRSLQARMLLTVLGLVAGMWLVALVATWYDTRHELNELLDAHLAQTAALLSTQPVEELVGGARRGAAAAPAGAGRGRAPAPVPRAAVGTGRAARSAATGHRAQWPVRAHGRALGVGAALHRRRRARAAHADRRHPHAGPGSAGSGLAVELDRSPSLGGLRVRIVWPQADQG